VHFDRIATESGFWATNFGTLPAEGVIRVAMLSLFSLCLPLQRERSLHPKPNQKKSLEAKRLNLSLIIHPTMAPRFKVSPFTPRLPLQRERRRERRHDRALAEAENRINRAWRGVGTGAVNIQGVKAHVVNGHVVMV
jgi:hypothetical protein